MDNIFISSGGFRNKLINEIATYIELIGCKNIEYSSGPYQEQITEKLLNLEIKNFAVQIHNYFPVPKKSTTLYMFHLAFKKHKIKNNAYY